MASPTKKSKTIHEIPLSRTAPSYLHSNSTSHAWSLGAIAELIDNAYDPDVNATSIYIDCETIFGNRCLTFTDDGNGMDMDQMHKLLSFGFSEKEELNGKVPIGRFGNGFKSGTMRLGKDAIVFSKKHNSKVIGFLSQTYLKEINAQDVRVPIVDFNALKPEDDSLAHIKIHSIFGNNLAIKDEFQKIKSPKGTRIVIYNLTKEEILQNSVRTTRYVLNTEIDKYDIRLDESQCSTKEFRGKIIGDGPKCDYSLRAYCSVLYLNPKIKIYLREKKVRTVMIAKSLKETEKDLYRPMGGNSKVKITFGFNPKKDPYGVCFYHNNRLIKSYQRLGYQKNDDGRGSGIVGVIECNFLKPTHNKQDFEDGTAHSRCIKAVGDKLNDYWNEKRENANTEESSHQFLGESRLDLPDYTWVQCDKCSKFRKLPESVSPDSLPEQWDCSMNKNLFESTCDAPQEPEDSDDELSRPTYHKNYKKQAAKRKRDADKIMKEKNMMLSKCSFEEIKKIRNIVVSKKTFKTPQEQDQSNASTEEKNKSSKLENNHVSKQLEGSHTSASQQNGVLVLGPGFLQVKRELVTQEKKLEKCISELENNQSNQKSDCEEYNPHLKKLKAKHSDDGLREELTTVNQSNESHDKGHNEGQLKALLLEVKSIGVQTDIDQPDDFETKWKNSELKLQNSELKLQSLRGRVISLLKMVVSENDTVEMIDDLEGDKVDEVLQDLIDVQ